MTIGKHVSRFAFCFLYFLWLVPANGFSELVDLPRTRAAYWAQGGTNLATPEPIEIPFVKRDELFQLLKEKNRVVFLDIREPNEFEQTHLPKALNVSFLNRAALYDQLKTSPDQVVIPYCNWDFRGYVAAVELKRKGVPNVAMMYPHGLRGWIASGLPVAGKEAGRTDEEAFSLLTELLDEKLMSNSSSAISSPHPNLPPQGGKEIVGKDIHVTIRILPKIIEPTHIKASVGDRLTVDFIAEEEDHWFVIPSFGVNLHLNKGEKAAVTLNLTRAGYFPMGCISCCVRYQCKIRQAILVDVKEPLSSYGE